MLLLLMGSRDVIAGGNDQGVVFGFRIRVFPCKCTLTGVNWSNQSIGSNQVIVNYGHVHTTIAAINVHTGNIMMMSLILCMGLICKWVVGEVIGVVVYGKQWKLFHSTELPDSFTSNMLGALHHCFPACLLRSFSHCSEVTVRGRRRNRESECRSSRRMNDV